MPLALILDHLSEVCFSAPTPTIFTLDVGGVPFNVMLAQLSSVPVVSFDCNFPVPTFLNVLFDVSTLWSCGS